MKQVLFSLILALGTLSFTPALAQDARADRVESFDDELVDGATEAPLVENLRVRRHRALGTLIQARTNFLPEMFKSVSDL